MTDQNPQYPVNPASGQPPQPYQPPQSTPPQQPPAAVPPQQPYGAPQNAPQAAPQQPYGAPQGAPQSAPQQPYGAPQGAPQQPYGAPQQPYGAPQQPYGAAPAGIPLSPAEDKQWAMWSHFGGVLSFLPSLIIFLVFKDRGAFTKQESKEALNWQITWAIIAIVWSIVVGIIGSVAASAAAASGDYTAALGMTSTIGLLTYVPYIANLIFSIMGGAKISGGAPGYRYPVNFRFIK